MNLFNDALGLQKDESPFPWQVEFLAKLVAGLDARFSLDIPTGLGKTSVMAAWLVARSQWANQADRTDLPRRLVYVVDRRAVVDQATREAERLRTWVDRNSKVKQSLGLDQDQRLPISTLRGQFADNRQWLSDPSSPSIVVGTVDMIGSRLLFEGYGVSRKMRPCHAGFLGADTLFVLDEAHLVPPFEALLSRVVEPESTLGGNAAANRSVPRNVLLSLSATGRGATEGVLRVSEKDLTHQVAGQRLRAVKRLRVIESESDEVVIVDRLAAEVWELADQGTAAKRIIVFCNSRSDALKVEQAVTKLAKGDKKQGIPARQINCQLFVGARRVRERQQVEQWLEQYGFLAGVKATLENPAFVFATSAGEVGVDLDADHMLGDLVAFERMVQRFGRVNRRGHGEAEIRVLVQRDKPNATEKQALEKALEKPDRQRGAKDHELVRQFDKAPKYRAALEALPMIDGESARDASPEALRQLKLRTNDDDDLFAVLDAATTPAPLRPELTRPILDSWSMTSLEKHSARPLVAPWLRGWVEDEPQTTIVWRKHLPTITARCTDKQISDFFEAAPIHLTEKLETTGGDVFNWLLKRVDKIVKLKVNPKKTAPEKIEALPHRKDIVAIVLDRSGDVVRRMSLDELRFGTDRDSKKRRVQFSRDLEHCTLIVDARIGGLSSGLLDEKASETDVPDAADGVLRQEWIELTDEDMDPIPPFRILESSADDLKAQLGKSRASKDWKPLRTFPIQSESEDEPSRYLVLQKFRQTVTSEESRSTSGWRSLEDHLADTQQEVERLAKRLGLSAELTLVMRIAARNHDRGKNCQRWQNAFSAPETGRPYAKTPGPFHNSLLDGYRHEFGSLPSVSRDSDFAGLSVELKELTLHLVAAHHGFGRPVIRVDSCENAPPSVLADRARDVALRFSRMQKLWGPWGLAWLESILRAADQRASAMVDEDEMTSVRTVVDEVTSP